MELSPGLTFQLLFFMLICKMSWALEVPISSDKHQPSRFPNENSNVPEEEKRGVGTRDLVRMFLMAIHNNYPNGVQYGRLGGIPFRPARRIGSEFLGKRSMEMPLAAALNLNLNDDELEELLQNPTKRARAKMGSEFLGKRRLGSEFLGKRTSTLSSSFGVNFKENPQDESDEAVEAEGKNSFLKIPFSESSGSPLWGKNNNIQSGAHFHSRNFEKRALGNEFLGKRKYGLQSGPYDWAWKRARLGSEFLGKRALGSEFLGKRSGQRQYQPDSDLEVASSV